PGFSAQDRAAAYDDFGDILARLHQVDVDAIGLGDYGRPGDYIDRQLGRFTKQYRAAESERIPEMEALIERLPGRAPGGRRDGIEGWHFYLAFGLFRLASIMQGVYRRVQSGAVASEFPEVNTAPLLARQALAILEQGA